MGEWREIPALLRQTKADIAVWLVTFALTVFADLTVAVEVGMVLAALLFIRRVAATTTVSRVTTEYVDEGRPHILQDKQIPDYVAIFRIHGPFLFGATDKITRVIDDLPELPADRDLPPAEHDGDRRDRPARARGRRRRAMRASGRTAVFCGAREQPRAVMHQAQFVEHVGATNVCPHVEAALHGRRSFTPGGSVVPLGG